MDYCKLHQEGLKLQYKIGDLRKSSVTCEVLLKTIHNREKFNTKLKEIVDAYKVDIQNKVYEDDAASLAFLMGLQGDIQDLSFVSDIKEMSKIWGLSESHIKTMAQNKEILAKKIGTSWAIDKRQPNPKKYGLDK
uniref:hypothetical protein n=1 Tax=Bacillus multifaciens TaxID=3068506 RepID=UPI003F49AD80